MKHRKLWKIPIPIAIAIIIALFAGGGALIYALTKTTEKAGPVGYWKFDEGAGTIAYDASGNANNGTLTNFDFNDTSNWTTGKVAGALKFDGSNDYVNCGSAASLTFTTQDFSLEEWIYLNSMGDYTEISKGNASIDGYYTRIQADGTARFSVSQSGAIQTTLTAVGEIVANKWYHIVYVKSGDKGYIYINGVDRTVTQPTLINPATNVRNFYIGQYDTGIARVNGKIDDVRIYNRALSADEIRYLYNRKGPVGWWPFDDGSGSVVRDTTENSNHGTWSGTGTHWAEGKINGAGQFADASGDYVSIPNAITARTISFWVNLDTTTESIISGDGTGITVSAGTMSYGAWDNCFIDAVDTDTISTGWHHIVLTSTTDVAMTSIKLGYTDGGLDGKLDDVRIYNYARSASEIRTDYNWGYAARFGGSYDLSRGLVGHWRFEEGGGLTSTDSSGSGNHGTLYNFDFNSSSGWTTGNSAAATGGALRFDGVNDYVSAADFTLISTQNNADFSLSAWVKPETSVASKAIIVKDEEIRLTTDASGYPQCEIYDGTSWQTPATSSQVLSLDTWQYLTCRYDKTNLKIYFNGVEKGSSALTSAVNNATSSFDLGKDASGGSAYFSGAMDEVRVYNRALSADEIRYLYNRRGPVGWWKFDEGSGSTAYDSSGNGNNGTISGASSTTGKINAALSFDGTDDKVILPQSTITLDDNFTVNLWVNLVDTNGNKPLIDIVYYHNQAGWWLDWDTSSLKFAYTVSNTTYSWNISKTRDTEWHMITLTYDTGNSAINMYADGILLATRVPEGVVDITAYGGNTQQWIGAQYYNGRFFSGLIDDVRIYNYARTAAEIRTDYNEGFAVKFGGSYDLTRGLVGHWSFGEGGGLTSTDSSGSGNHGTLTNFDFNQNSGWTSGNSAANTGGALQFDGVDDYVDAGNGASLNFGTADYSLEMWVYINAWPSVGHSRIISKISGSVEMEFRFDPSGYLIFAARDAVGELSVSKSGLTLGQWFYGVGVRQAGVGTVYINAVAGTPAAMDRNVTNAGSLLIGCRDGPTRCINGLIDEVRIYNRALTADEIRYLYNRKQPIGHWKFDEGAGTKAYDSSINAYHSTITGAEWCEGKIGRALDFDSTDHISVGDVGKVNTVAFWINDSNATDGILELIDNSKYISIASGAITTTITGATIYVNAVAGATELASGWNHVAVTTATAVSAATVNIGEANNDYLLGQLDDVRLYNYARTAEEIRADYNAGMSTYFK